MTKATALTLAAILAASTLLATPQAWAADVDDVVQISSDTYMINVKNWGGAFGDPGKSLAKAIRIANEFAKKRGKVAVAVTSEVRSAQFASGLGGATYQFRLVDPDSPEATGVSLERGPDSHQKIEVVTNAPPPATPAIAPQQAPKPDLYTELLKLEELRKRGLLTDAEFDAAKQRLLQQ